MTAQPYSNLTDAVNRAKGLVAPSLNPAPVAPRPPLLQAGLAHEDQRIRRAAEKAKAAIDRLSGLVREYDAKAEARAEVGRLERELAEAKAALRGPKAKATPGGIDAKAVRAWAATQGITVPPRGRIPADVLARYTARAA